MREALPHPAGSRFVRRRAGGRSALVREDFTDAFDELGLLLAADLEPAVLVREAHERAAAGGPDRGEAFLLEGRAGRGAVAVLPAGSLGRVAVRPYRRGGLARRLSRSRYLRGRRAERELRIGERLRGRGVPVVETVAAVRSDLRWGYRAALVTRWAEGTIPAGRALRDRSAAAAAPILRELGRTAARLHAAGGWHADLHADNFLVARREDARAEDGPEEGGPEAAEEEGTLPLLVDLDRGRALPFPVPAAVGRWSLRRLARHLRKHGLTGALGAMDALRDAYRRERARLRS